MAITTCLVTSNTQISNTPSRAQLSWAKRKTRLLSNCFQKSELTIAYGELSLREASLQLLASILEFLAMLSRMAYELLQLDVPADVEAPSTLVSREVGSIPKTRLDEGDVEEDCYGRNMLRERMKALAMEKPKRYYVVARGRDIPIIG